MTEAESRIVDVCEDVAGRLDAIQESQETQAANQANTATEVAKLASDLSSQRSLLEEIKRLLVENTQQHGEFHQRVISDVDQLGQDIHRAQNLAQDVEARLAKHQKLAPAEAHGAAAG